MQFAQPHRGQHPRGGGQHVYRHKRVGAQDSLRLGAQRDEREVGDGEVHEAVIQGLATIVPLRGLDSNVSGFIVRGVTNAWSRFTV